MSHPPKPVLRPLSRPYDETRYSPPITQAYGNIADFEPATYDYHDGCIGWVWEPGCTSKNIHGGIDYGLAAGTPVLAAASGTVRSAGWDATGFGNLTVIDHGNRLLTFYAHQASMSVVSGKHVMDGQKIGTVGTTGNSTGPHLHFACGMDDGLGYWDFFSPVPYITYVSTPAEQYPTGAAYKVIVPMYLRSAPELKAPHVGALLPVGMILRSHGGWSTHWRGALTPDGRDGFAFAKNLSLP